MGDPEGRGFGVGRTALEKREDPAHAGSGPENARGCFTSLFGLSK